jgi:phage-related protein
MAKCEVAPWRSYRGKRSRGYVRAVYTVKFAGAVYVLHAFQKKSKKGMTTPKAEVDLIRRRLTAAEKHYGEWRASQAQEEGDRSGAGS